MTKPHPKSLFDIATELEEKHSLLHALVCAFDAVYLKDDYRDVADALEDAIWKTSRSLKDNVAEAYAAANTAKGEAA